MGSKSKFVRTMAAVGVASVFSFALGSASAAPFSAIFKNGVNVLSDDDAEAVLKWDPTLSGGAGAYRAFIPGVDIIDVKDITVGLVGLTSYQTGPILPASDYNEVTAVYAVQALTKSAALPGILCGAGAGGALTPSCAAYTFGTPTVGLNGVIGLMNTIYGTTMPLLGAGLTTADTIGMFFEDVTGAPDFALSGGTIKDRFDAAYASDSSDIARIGIDLTAGNGDFFSIIAPADPVELFIYNAAFPGAGAGSYTGSATVGYQNVPGWLLGPDVGIVGSVRGNTCNPAAGALTDCPFGIWTDTTFTLNAKSVPEPGTVGLLGLGLAGLGLGALRRRKQTA